MEEFRSISRSSSLISSKSDYSNLEPQFKIKYYYNFQKRYLLNFLINFILVLSMKQGKNTSLVLL